MQPFFNNTDSGRVYSPSVSTYQRLSPDAFFLFSPTSAYADPVSFEVWVAPMDEAAAPGVCQPDLTKAHKFQWAEPTCPGYAANAAGDLVINLTDTGVAPASNEFAAVAGRNFNVRVPVCPGNAFITLKKVGTAANIDVFLVWNKAGVR